MERRVERRFDVPASNVALKIDTFSGSVRIEASDGNTIEVVVVQSADVTTEAAMDDRLAALDLVMTQQDGTVMLTADYRKYAVFSWKSWPPVALSYEIKVPRRCDVQVFAREGSIVVGSLQGRVVLGNEAGGIFTRDIDGPVTARSKSGEIAITAATGAIDASTASGNITVGRAGSSTRLSSDGGYIELQQASGEVKISGNGSDAKVGFTTPIAYPVDIAVSGGSIMLVVESGGAATFDLRSSMFGKVSVRGAIPLKVTAGKPGRSKLQATLNGGGPVIMARASGGSVVLRGVEPLPEARAENPNGSVGP
ncbi:DUF4097 domain-containing protein [Rariglobus hedericola]|uniref:DUF4097 domain-containing protein n=1 Tax=Rariglobus hedericola TaxID=2597822 RepID=A0A556QJS9_9BACT|nr:DUF4097 domain-containing protein [Rariglobus hedericola]TSJ76889.1 DUF4097 domain-containing protein [Rariglobus hedericola]